MDSIVASSERVSAADFVRGFGVWREKASEAPVVITNHGRDTHVLLSAKAFSLIGGSEVTERARPSDLTDRLSDSVRDCIIVVDQDLTVMRVNAAACDFFRLGAAQMVGASIERALPKLRQSFALRNLLKTLSVGERSATDVPSITHEGLWLHIETIPVEEGAAILFSDITSDVETHRVADVKQAVLDAFGFCGSMGYAKISPREMIETSDDALRNMVGLSDAALKRAKFSGLLVTSARAAFHEALERLFSQHMPVKLDSRLLTNSGVELTVRLSIVELRGEYTTEGAIVAVSAPNLLHPVD
uniref:PAS domain-containing protein n=1 Tax=uncultured Sphingomonas sp. TaxID=158754 RepID=UPI0035CA2E24